MPRSSQPGSEAAVRLTRRPNHHRRTKAVVFAENARILARLLRGDYTKLICADLGVTVNSVNRAIRVYGLSMLRVTAAERAAVLAQRKGANGW